MFNLLLWYLTTVASSFMLGVWWKTIRLNKEALLEKQSACPHYNAKIHHDIPFKGYHTWICDDCKKTNYPERDEERGN
jgi:hypothetical protein